MIGKILERLHSKVQSIISIRARVWSVESVKSIFDFTSKSVFLWSRQGLRHKQKACRIGRDGAL